MNVNRHDLLIFLMTCPGLNYKPCHMPVKHRCPIRKNDHKKPTFLLCEWHLDVAGDDDIVSNNVAHSFAMVVGNVRNKGIGIVWFTTTTLALSCKTLISKTNPLVTMSFFKHPTWLLFIEWVTFDPKWYMWKYKICFQLHLLFQIVWTLQ